MSDNIQVKRCLHDILHKDSRNNVIVLTGARQTGKTTLVKILFPELKYINLDAIEDRIKMKEIITANWGNEVGVAVIDEAQKEPSIFEKVKYAYDSNAITFSVLLGSAQILLLKNIRETLAGRVSFYELWPLMLSELLPSKNPTLFELIINANSIGDVLNGQPSVLLGEEDAKKRQSEDYLLKWGGMPKLLHLASDEEKRKWLKDYEYTYLERDLADLARLRDLDHFRKFQKIAALRSAKLLNYSELAKDSDLSVDSARRYCEYLRLSYQAILLQPYYENLTSSVIKSPKLYFVDIGILRQLSGFIGEMNGEIFETYVVSEIYKWIKTNQKEVELFFYRTRSGLEADLLIKTPKGFIGIEIKLSAKIGPSDVNSLKAIADKLKDRWIGGICVNRGNKIEKISEPNIWVVPAYRLLS